MSTSAPRTLDDLLKEFRAAKVDANTDLDALIRSSGPWTKRFLEKHLIPRGRKDQIVALKFLAFTSQIQRTAGHLTEANPSKKAKISLADRKDLATVYARAATIFFDPVNDDTMLSLKNERVFEEVEAVRERLEATKSGPVTDEELVTLLKVRDEVRVRLEAEYMEFVRVQPEGALACLLCLL